MYARNFVHTLEHLEAVRPEKEYFFSFYGKCMTIIDLFEGL